MRGKNFTRNYSAYCHHWRCLRTKLCRSPRKHCPVRRNDDPFKVAKPAPTSVFGGLLDLLDDQFAPDPARQANGGPAGTP